MGVLVVFIMLVRMGMCYSFMTVLMIVTLRKMEPHTCAHEEAGRRKLPRQ
jgi:hypothetical protein